MRNILATWQMVTWNCCKLDSGFDEFTLSCLKLNLGWSELNLILRAPRMWTRVFRILRLAFPFLGKVAEKGVMLKLQTGMDKMHYLVQSDFKTEYGTERIADIQWWKWDKGSASIFALLDLSVAFNITDHDILLGLQIWEHDYVLVLFPVWLIPVDGRRRRVQPTLPFV